MLFLAFLALFIYKVMFPPPGRFQVRLMFAKNSVRDGSGRQLHMQMKRDGMPPFPFFKHFGTPQKVF